MNAIIDAAVTHARTVISILLLLLVAGGFAYVGIPKEADPDVEIPILYVNIHHEGISPEDSERLLIKPIEEELRGTRGVKEMRSTAYEGGGNVILEFEAGFDPDIAMADAREKVDLAKPELPEDASEPTVHEINLSLFPVIAVTLSGNVPERALLSLARGLRDEIESISAVLDVQIGGDREELVELVVDPLVLESYGLDARGIIEAFGRSNQLVAAGSLDSGQGRFSVKVPGLFESARDILDMPVKVNGDSVVRFRDIGSLRRTFKDSQGFARINGKPALVLEVSKRAGQNIIETVEQVRAVVENRRRYWPAEVRVGYSQDNSTDIRAMLADLENNVMSAILLVMIVVVAALGPRSGALVGIAIPGSFLTGILVLSVAGLTVNVVVLFSLILAVGMLVDGAIVVTEYADRKMSEGLEKRDAYAMAAKRMAWPIVAATATTLAAFLPLLFWPGVVGAFMKFLPITLIATLGASLMMALIFVPTLGSVFGRAGGTAKRAAMKALAAGETGDIAETTGFTGAYLRLLRGALHRPGLIVVAAIGVLIGVNWYYGEHGRGIEFFPDVEPQNVMLQIHGRGNLSIEERDFLLRQVEARILDQQREKPEFHAIYARSVAASGTQGDDDEAEDVIGTVDLEFTDWHRRRPADQILAEIRERTADFAGIFIEIREQEAGPPVGKPIQIEIASEDPLLLEPAAEQIVGAMRGIDGIVDIDDGRPVPGIEWRLVIDRAQAAKFGADVTLIGSYVRMITNGMQLGEYRPDDAVTEIDIVVRLPEAYRNFEQLRQIRVRTAAGLVPISNFVTREAAPKVNILRRSDGSRAITVKADVASGPDGEKILVDDKVRELRAALAGATIDPRVSIAFRGEDEERKAAQAFLGRAFMVALFLMAIILVTQFNSFYSAFLILSAVVMSTVGVMLGLLITDQPFGIVMTGIGLIALAGIVVNNNIVLIDTFDRLKQQYPGTKEAILRTGAQRLRPVLLTTVTTILGLMPMVMGANIDFPTRVIQVGAPSTQWWRQLATAIVFGLGFATILTLVVTPSALMLRANARGWWTETAKPGIKRVARADLAPLRRRRGDRQAPVIGDRSDDLPRPAE